jgi:hypothetical protein
LKTKQLERGTAFVRTALTRLNAASRQLGFTGGGVVTSNLSGKLSVAAAAGTPGVNDMRQAPSAVSVITNERAQSSHNSARGTEQV